MTESIIAPQTMRQSIVSDVKVLVVTLMMIMTVLVVGAVTSQKSYAQHEITTNPILREYVSPQNPSWSGLLSQVPASAAFIMPTQDMPEDTSTVEAGGSSVTERPSGNGQETPVVRMGQTQIRKLVCSYNWDCNYMMNVMWRESRYKADAYNFTPVYDAYGRENHAHGLFQILLPLHLDCLAWEDAFDAEKNIEAAWCLYQKAGYSPWW